MNWSPTPNENPFRNSFVHPTRPCRVSRVMRMRFIALAVMVLLAPGRESFARALEDAKAAPDMDCSGVVPLRPYSGFLWGGFERVKYQRMASYCFDKQGMFTVVLSDGSIWQQWPDDVRYAYWRASPQHYEVLLRGDDANGTMTVENDGLDYRVRRIG